MKACLMRVNYDPKYMVPHQKKGRDTYESRLGVTQRIYCGYSDKRIRDTLDDAAKKRHKAPDVTEKPKIKPNKTGKSPASKENKDVVNQRKDLPPISRKDSYPTEKDFTPPLRKAWSPPPLDRCPRKESPLDNNAGLPPEDDTVIQQESTTDNNQVETHKEAVAHAHQILTAKPPRTKALHSSVPQLNSSPRNTCPLPKFSTEKPLKRYQSNFKIFPGRDRKPLTTLSLAADTQNQDAGPVPFERSRTLPVPQQIKVMSTGVTQMHKRARVEAERAIRDRKIFTIMGPYHSLRLALRKRGWVEKFPNVSATTGAPYRSPTIDLELNTTSANDKRGRRVLPWEEENGFYGLMSAICKNSTPAFVFSVKSVDVDTTVSRSSQMVNHYGKARSFTTKAGLSQNLHNLPWYEKADHLRFFPRCYRLEELDEKQAFIDDYRHTACFSFLKKFIAKYKNMDDTNNDVNTTSQDDVDCQGEAPDQQRSATRISMFNDNCFLLMKGCKKNSVSVRALEIAMQQSEKFLQGKSHEDIDILRETNSMTDDDWDEFLRAYYVFVHKDGHVVPASRVMVGECEDLLKKCSKHWYQMELDGERNVWILKPGAKSRGRGIQCLDRLDCILRAIATGDSSMVIQKYIERPLLVHNTKFDIRVWFLVTDWNPLTVWIYNDCYLRFCSREFTLDSFHVSIHLSNNSVQRHYNNGPRSASLPDDNMWTSDQFDQYLRDTGFGQVWSEKVFPGIKKAILCTLVCTQELIECRKSAFELYGADFMMTEDMRPWLLEINSSPSMARTTRVTQMLVDNVLEDTLKVVLDRRRDRECPTGQFRLAYRQAQLREPPSLDLPLLIQGRKVSPKKMYFRHHSKEPTGIAARSKDKLLDKSMKDKVLDKSMKDKVLDKSIKDKVSEKSIKDKVLDRSVKDKVLDKSVKDNVLDKSVKDNR